MISAINRWFSNKTFSKKILYSYLIFCMIPLILTVTIFSTIFFDALFSRTKSSITDSGNKISSLLFNKFSQYDSVINSLVYDPLFICSIQNPDDVMSSYEMNDYISEKIDEIKISIPEMRSFTIYADLPYENDLFEPFSEINNSSELLYASKNQRPTWYSKNGDSYIACPIKGLYNKKVLGLISMQIDMVQLVANFTELSLDEYGVYIYDSYGGRLYNLEIFSFEIGKITENMLKSTSERIFASGKYFILASSQVSAYGINVYCIVPETSITQPIRNYLIIPIIIWIICLFLVIIICYLLSHSLGKRVRQLEVQMTNVSKGDLTVFEPEKSLDEIGNISRFCSQTISQLNVLINDNYISQIKLKDAENKALIAQINPHFLYNTLNMIAGQAILSDNYIITDVVTQLSDYYRTTLNKGKNLILIRDELKNVIAYCNLQLRLHDYNFKVEYDLDKSVFDYSTINLGLQPLVENAIEHGIMNLPDGEGIIKISAKLIDEDIVFTIINNMPSPCSENPNTFLDKTTSGYGLKNIQNRIHIIFGEKYGLQLSSKDTYFYAVLTIPASNKDNNYEKLIITNNDEDI